MNGSFFPFLDTKAERLALGDPRLSLEERYGDHDGFVTAVREVSQRLVRRRLLLAEDASVIVGQAQASDILR